jgi:hypothetical protein
VARAEQSFHTQRPPGSTFTFVAQFDQPPRFRRTRTDARLHQLHNGG